jgi:hypothetical protein
MPVSTLVVSVAFLVVSERGEEENKQAEQPDHAARDRDCHEQR